MRLQPLTRQDQLAWELLLFEQHLREGERPNRIVVDLPVRCLVDGHATPLPGNVQNPGPAGLLLLLPELLPAETGVTVTTTSPPRELQLAGRIVWAQVHLGERPAHGVAFNEPTAGREAFHQVVLAEFLLRLGRAAAASSP